MTQGTGLLIVSTLSRGVHSSCCIAYPICVGLLASRPTTNRVYIWRRTIGEGEARAPIITGELIIIHIYVYRMCDECIFMHDS